MIRRKERGYDEIYNQNMINEDQNMINENQNMINESSDTRDRRRSHGHFKKRYLTVSNILIVLLLVLVCVLLSIVIGNTNILEKQPSIAKVSKNQISNGKGVRFRYLRG